MSGPVARTLHRPLVLSPCYSGGALSSPRRRLTSHFHTHFTSSEVRFLLAPQKTS